MLIPARDSLGHRDYDEEALTRCRIVLGCQGVGMTLAQIRLVLNRGDRERRGVIRAHQEALIAQRRELRRAEAFLEHVLTCRHTLTNRCPGCSAYARGGS